MAVKLSLLCCLRGKICLNWSLKLTMFILKNCVAVTARVVALALAPLAIWKSIETNHATLGAKASADTVSGAMTLSIKTLVLMTLSIMTLSIKKLSIKTQHKATQHKATQHKETQHKATQHKETQHIETQHNDTQHNDSA
jgi:hypothetical protein